MKIVFVINAHEFTAKHRLPLLAAAKAKGWSVEAIAPKNSPAFERLHDAGYTVHPVSLGRRSIGLVKEWGAIRSLVRLYNELKPDIVHHATIKPVIYGTIAARRVGVPAVVNAITGLGYVYTGGDLYSKMLRPVVDCLYRYALRHPNQRVIFQNSDDKAFIEGINGALPGESVLIPGSGVDTEYFSLSEYPPGEPLVIFPARMLWDKGVEEFVGAARILKKAGVAARYILVGGLDPGNRRGILKTQLDAWVREGVVEWWGHCDDMRAVYQAAHVVVLPSYREGLPKVLLEAAACGRPVIAADTPGCRDAVLDGETGYLVPAREASALADRIATLLSDAKRRARMGRAGRDRAEREFSIERVVSATLAVYTELMANTASGKQRSS